MPSNKQSARKKSKWKHQEARENSDDSADFPGTGLEDEEKHHESFESCRHVVSVQAIQVIIVVVISNRGRSNSNGESETIICLHPGGGKGKRKVRYTAQSLRGQISKI